MDSTHRAKVTCDACPLQRGCPAFANGRTACLFGMWPLTGTLTALCAVLVLLSLLPL